MSHPILRCLRGIYTCAMHAERSVSDADVELHIHQEDTHGSDNFEHNFLNICIFKEYLGSDC